MFELNHEDGLPMIKMKSHEYPIYFHFMEEELHGKPWYFDIKQYLKSQKYLETATKNDK